MSGPAPTTTQIPLSDDGYEDLLASLRARFLALTADAAGPPSLFTTAAPALYDAYLDALPPEQRQVKVCAACRRFTDRYGSLVRVDQAGKTISLLWDPETAPEHYRSAIRALADAVSKAPIDGVFLTEEKAWGTARTDVWTHFAVDPPKGLLFKPTAIKTTAQVMAEKRQDHETLLRALEAFPLDLVKKAHALLSTESLYRSEACLGVAKWLQELHKQRQGARSARARENLTWLAVARAPAGFCHVRSTMIGSLLEDLAADLPIAEVKAKFAAKMHPLQYQRPQAAPSAGNLERAEKIVEKLKSAGALERRFAKLEDVEATWISQTAPQAPQKKGVFGHLRGGAKSASPIDMPPIKMTWEKFARTVLPNASSIEFLVPTAKAPYTALVTAKDEDAPPILQWDFEDRRNPVTLYVYVNGSAPEDWNLKPGVHHPVTAVVLQPWMWHPTKKFEHQGTGVVFVLKGAKDLKHKQGGGFFPSYLKSEYHEIRATMEAYANTAVIAGRDEAEVCGIVLTKNGAWNQQFRVTSKDDVCVVYELDRWD